MQDGAKAMMEYDDETMVYTSGDYRVEIGWDQYKYVAESDGCLYFIPEKKPFETMYFSVDDIGPEEFKKLRDLSRSKLEAVN